MQSYPTYNYYPQPYPQTPHNPAALHSLPNGYQQYYQQVPTHPPPHIPAPVPYEQYVPYPSTPASHPTERPRSHKRNNTVPLRSALKQSSNPQPGPSTDSHNLTRQRTNSASRNALTRTRTQSNPKAPDLASGRDYNFVPGASLLFLFSPRQY